MKSVAFVQNLFREYYATASFLREAPSATEKREFGFASFEGWMLRHRSFKTAENLTSFLRESVPKDAYFSCAYYQDPEADMEKKGWLGADLIFDIDADHIPTSCNKVHDEWRCAKCSFSGKGIAPERCPICGGEKFDSTTWPCEVCLASAKNETVKLLDILMEDFGFAKDEARVFFSGHRGYHVHLETESVADLDATARKEIVDYVCGLNSDIDSKDPSARRQSRSQTPLDPELNAPGWRVRIAKCMYDLILNAAPEDYKSIGLKRDVIKTLMDNKDSILKNWGALGAHRNVKGLGPETWRKIQTFCLDALSSKVDTVVTTDIHRLIRLTGTLHGKTGLKKVECPIARIHDFDPFKSAVAFKSGTATISVLDAPSFRLGDELFGPYRNQKVELPTAAAALLICKDKAEVVA